MQFGESSKSPEEADRESESGIVLRELDCEREDFGYNLGLNCLYLDYTLREKMVPRLHVSLAS